jgi:alpha-mannosidase
MAAELYDEILPHIESSIYPVRQPIADWKIKEGEIEGAHSRSFKDKSWSTFRVPGSWGKNDKTFWFRQSVSIPPQWSGKPVVLLLDMPEALLYLDGEAFYGVDTNHDEVLLTSKARSNQIFLLAVEAYSGRKNDLNKMHRSELAVIDANAKALFHCLTTLHDLEELHEHGSQESKIVRELIRRTLVFLKYFKPGSEEYPNAIARAYSFLINAIETEPHSTLPGLVHLVGQSHLDVAWLWKLSETMKKCGRTFSTALRLVEAYPHFKFTQSQAFLYDLTKKNYPSLYKQIKERVVEGRWEPVGSSWVEPDFNIPNGESLVRQLLYGKRFFKSEFGTESNVFWAPDAFGFGWSLPQILRKSGIDYFFTTKLSWNDTNKFPYNTFWWQGIDGTKVLAHQPPVGLEGSVSPKDLAKSWEEFSQKEQNCTNVLQTFGFGDGGGGPTQKQVESSRVLKNGAGLPQSTLSTAKEFFIQASQQSDSLPTWNSDLYLEKHRGTFTTHGWIKKANRLAERQLYESELLSVLALLHGRSSRSGAYPQKELEQTWKRLLLNQFHDIVTGTSIADALEDARTDYGEIDKSASMIVRRALGALTERTAKSNKETRFSLFNTLGWQRNGYIEIEFKTAAKHFLVSDEVGRTVEHQVISNSKGSARLLCYVENIPPFSFTSLIVRPATEEPQNSDPWEISSKHIETPLFRIRVDAKGFFSSVYDKTMKKELIEKGKRGNLFQTFKDTPEQWDAWDIDPNFERQHLELLNLKKHQIIETGPLRATIRNTYVSHNGSELTQDVILYHKRPQIVFETKVRWKEKQTLLKVAFPFNVKTGQVTCETQFGAISRSSKHKTEFEKARYELPVQQWADLSDIKFGVSLLNDCKYGCDAKENVLRLTLLRSPFYPHPVEPWRFNDVKHTDQADHSFSYALSPHTGTWKQGELTRRAREFNNPILVLENVAGAGIRPIVTCNKRNIFIDSVKKAEDTDEIVLRLHEGHGDAVDATLVLGFKTKSATECDLMEQILKPLKLSKDKLQLKFRPFEIKTITFEAKAGKKR